MAATRIEPTTPTSASALLNRILNYAIRRKTGRKRWTREARRRRPFGLGLVCPPERCCSPVRTAGRRVPGAGRLGPELEGHGRGEGRGAGAGWRALGEACSVTQVGKARIGRLSQPQPATAPASSGPIRSDPCVYSTFRLLTEIGRLEGFD